MEKCRNCGSVAPRFLPRYGGCCDDICQDAADLRAALADLAAAAHRLAGDDDDWEDDDGPIPIQQALARARVELGLPRPEGAPRPHGF